MTRPDLPTGTVTFLFSDIAGSTRLVSELGPDTYRDVLELHHALMRQVFAAHAGVERGTQGDAFLVVFREAPAAVAAAVAAQRGLASATWPAGVAIRVRMGLHTGVGVPGGDDYVGLDINRAARITGAGHGGQVLLSDATRSLVADSLPDGTTIRQLGEHRLRDLDRPELVHQLIVEGLPSDFPPLKAERGPASTIPPRLTSFLGRDRELAELRTLLETKRLVTLTGPGGTGKTSLAVELARALAERYADGVWVVPLDAVTDPALVAPTIATRIGLAEAPGRSAEDALVAFCAGRTMLLVLDNFEQVVSAAPLVGELLRGAPDLKIVVTSRAPLHVSAEQEFPVPPLALPDEDVAASVLGSPAVELFLERARQVRPGFGLNDDEAPLVAEICRRLDGLPLGIELAASRVGLLAVRDIARRLAARLDLPGMAPRDLPERQRTLTSTVEWSVDLLDERSRIVLGRLSVFAGGWRLDEAIPVCGSADGDDVLDDLAALADHSLVRLEATPDGQRFRLLETIRLVAAGRLAAAGDEAVIRRRHAQAYLAIAEASEPRLTRRGQPEIIRVLEAEQDNFRAALNWAIATGEAELALRLAGALWRFWVLRGRVAEGTALVDAALAMPGAEAPSHYRVVALGGAGGLAWWRDDLPRADQRYREEVELARELGDEPGLADGLFNLAHTVRILGAAGAHTPLLDEASAIQERLGDGASAARTRAVRAWSGLHDDPVGGAIELEAQLPLLDALGDDFYAGLVGATLSWLALGRGDIETALRHGLRAQQHSDALGDLGSMTLGLHEAAGFLAALGDLEGAATLEAAFGRLADRHGIRPPAGMLLGPGDQLAESLVRLRSEPSFEAARQHGETMSLEDGQHYVDERLKGLLDGSARSAGPFAASPSG